MRQLLYNGQALRRFQGTISDGRLVALGSGPASGLKHQPEQSTDFCGRHGHASEIRYSWAEARVELGGSARPELGASTRQAQGAQAWSVKNYLAVSKFPSGRVSATLNISRRWMLRLPKGGCSDYPPPAMHAVKSTVSGRPNVGKSVCNAALCQKFRAPVWRALGESACSATPLSRTHSDPASSCFNSQTARGHHDVVAVSLTAKIASKNRSSEYHLSPLLVSPVDAPSLPVWSRVPSAGSDTVPF